MVGPHCLHGELMVPPWCCRVGLWSLHGATLVSPTWFHGASVMALWWVHGESMMDSL